MLLRTAALSASQKAVVTRAITAGGDLGVALDGEQCAYLVGRIAHDIGLKSEFPEVPSDIMGFFDTSNFDQLRLRGAEFLSLFERLLRFVPDGDTYFDCLAVIHKRRLKYKRILEAQPIPTIAQVGPRGLLQYGLLTPRGLSGFLFWRKWLFDIDNRAGQETGYVFEPIVARCIGGESYSASKSPVRRQSKPSDGRQVDCIFEDKAYEIKLRVTMAASGQGRWGEEKAFPGDCSASGYTPILLVFDDTQAHKLDELSAVFQDHGGDVKIGSVAWQHLEDLAGDTMGRFLELYIRTPLNNLLASAPDPDGLPDFSIVMQKGNLHIKIGDENLTIERSSNLGLLEDDAEQREGK